MTANMDDKIKMEIFNLQAELCKSLSDPTRLMIIYELRGGMKSVGELSEQLKLKQSTTSQHLAVLRKAGMVIPHRQGSSVYYNLVTTKITSACDIVRELIAEKLHRDQALTRVL